MNSRSRKAVAVFALGGIYLALHGVVPCIRGYTYSVAAQHERSTVGRVVRTSHRSSWPGHAGPGAGRIVGIFLWAPWEHRSTTVYTYVFSVNGVKMDDSSDVCATPLAPGACDNQGPVLVYYSYQPYSNSRLEDFTVPSSKSYRTGMLVLAIGFPVLLLGCAGVALSKRKEKGQDDSASSGENGKSVLSEVPDDLHIAPGE
jgi:hypothetical protein